MYSSIQLNFIERKYIAIDKDVLVMVYALHILCKQYGFNIFS